ncbi:hypothetical protein CYG48_01140 [Neorhizobium sp. SOG26]|nr:hypothetical protein CYG48_01140 [Neorhizobium sp. SOG26]
MDRVCARRKRTRMAKTFVQIGAGAGDRDPRANFRDGFSEFVKGLPQTDVANVVLVEPNPVNITKLQECWVDYPQAAIFQMGVVPDNLSDTSLTFYWAPEDGPHFQVFSCSLEHVKKHYPQSDLKSLSVKVMTLSEFLKTTLGNRPVEYLALDIEGLDAEIILNTDWTQLNVKNISFEILHLHDRKPAVLQHLVDCGYREAGLGFDTHGWDLLYSRV